MYKRFKKYFGYLNTGHKGKQYDVYPYNGGLFKPDELLDEVKIDDDLLYAHTLKLSEYDFDSEVDVNILGHIFENSLNEIEEIQTQLEENPDQAEVKISKRKKDGVFYTPKYITKYIVENTVGKLCEEHKETLNLVEDDYQLNRKKKTKTKLLQKLKDYRDWLLQLTIVDPACGSGAFLNEALNFLIAEHQYVDELETKLMGGGFVFPNVENSILEHNLFGVDINNESVEIAKLSLWLRTAQPNRKLNDLSNNIKCGNSLIDDPEVAGDKAFNWEKEFPQVFHEQDKKAFHITTAIHDSRTSDRMKSYKVRERREGGTNPYPNVIYFTPEDDLVVTQSIAEIVREDQLKLLAYNICADHIHLLLVCELEDIPSIMQKLKSITSRKVNKARKTTKGHATRGHVTRGHDPLRYKNHDPLHKEKNKPLWQQKYSQPKEVTSQEQLSNTINYIRRNRSKHELPKHSDELQEVIEAMCCTTDEAFTPTYKGGFDVVIGNPPYVNIANIENSLHREYYKKNFKTVKNKSDLYSIFIEKGNTILRDNGILSFIFPNSWLGTSSFSRFREFLIESTKIEELIKLPSNVFADAVVTTIILTFKNQKVIDNTIVLKEYKNTEFKLLPYRLEYSRIRNSSTLTFSFDKEIKFEIPTINLGELAEFSLGIKTSNDKRFILQEKIDDDCYPMLRGKDISRYYYNKPKEYIWYKPVLMREKKGAGPRKLEIFKGEKIFIQDVAKTIISFYTNEFILTNDTLSLIHKLKQDYQFKFILALLNSNLINSWFNSNFQEGLHIKINQLQQIPIPKVELLDQQVFIEKTDQMLALNKDLQDVSSKFQRNLQRQFPQELEKLPKKLQDWYALSFVEFIKELKKKKIKLSLSQEAEWEDYFLAEQAKATNLKNQINQTDKDIDQMVYELYGLTEEEIEIVEEA